MRPRPFDPKRPEGGPESRARIDTPSHFESTILPTMESLGSETGRCVLRLLSFFPRVSGGGIVGWIHLALAPAFDDEHAIPAKGVVGLVPLEFPISDEAVFVRPFLRVRPSRIVALMCPDLLVFLALRFGDGDCRDDHTH